MVRPLLSHRTINNVISLGTAAAATGLCARCGRSGGVPLHGQQCLHMHEGALCGCAQEGGWAQALSKLGDFAAELRGQAAGGCTRARLRWLTQ